MKKSVALALRILITVGFLLLVFWIIDFRKGIEIVRNANLVLIAAMVPVLAVPVVFLAWRWKMLLAENGFDVTYGRIYAVTYAGYFFNLFLPGGAGGDIAKAVIASKGETRKAGIVGTIILDRFIGLGTMIVIAAATALPFLGHEKLRPVVITVLALLAGAVIGYVVYFNGPLRRSRFGQAVKARLPFKGVIAELDQVMATMRNARRVILKGMALSAVAQSTTILAVFGLARALHFEVPLGPFFLLEPIVFILTAVPVSIGGWGVDSMIYGALFPLVGMAQNDAIVLSLVQKIATLAAAFPGLLLFAGGATGKRPAA